ncbi:hypothetical protein [Gulosibacter chungangensis]|nr:hypothetical protein [Gulosibacter chungangensis]
MPETRAVIALVRVCVSRSYGENSEAAGVTDSAKHILDVVLEF